MTIIIPSRKELLEQTLSDIQAEIPEVNPFLRENYIKILAVAFANKISDLYGKLTKGLQVLFPDTSIDDFARRWGNLKGLDRNPAISATGLLTITGNSGGIIPEGTQLQTIDGKFYETINSDYTIAQHTINIISLTSSAGVAYATTSGMHYFATNNNVTISGANDVIYNGTFVITIIDLNKFIYTIVGTPPSPDPSISITATLTFTNATISAIDTGLITNLNGGAKLSLTSPITDVDNDNYAQFDGITGGTDIESDLDYRNRYLEVYHSIQSPFSASNISIVTKTVPGVTRVWVFVIIPYVGDVSVYFVRDNDENIIPSFAEIQKVKDKWSTILPASTPLSDTGGLIIRAPSPKVLDFIIGNLVPNTISMREAITENLEEFFRTQVNVSENIPQERYRAVIYQTIDDSTVEIIISFTLVQPAGEIQVLAGELPMLGTINYI